MPLRIFSASLITMTSLSTHPDTASTAACFEASVDSFSDLYVWLHIHPELSFQEKKTAARIAAECEIAGFDVTTGVGGHSVVALLRNGSGPKIMLRTDVDALPVTEETGQPYASTMEVENTHGSRIGVMHACGHDSI